MSDSVVIKEIGKEKIELTEYKIFPDFLFFAWCSTAISLVCLMFILASLYLSQTFGPLCLIFGPLCLIAIGVNTIIFGISTKYEFWRIEIADHRDKIDIRKNNPAADQAAICAAAKNLEAKAREYDDHRKFLEGIAERCK